MLIQLPNGKTIEMSVEEYLDMSDSDLQYLNSLNYGNEIENPFFGSAVEKRNHSEVDEFELEIDQIDEAKKIAEQDIEKEDLESNV